MKSATLILLALPAALAALSASNLKISSDTLTLPVSFDPIEGNFLLFTSSQVLTNELNKPHTGLGSLITVAHPLLSLQMANRPILLSLVRPLQDKIMACNEPFLIV